MMECTISMKLGGLAYIRKTEIKLLIQSYPHHANADVGNNSNINVWPRQIREIQIRRLLRSKHDNGCDQPWIITPANDSRSIHVHV